MPEPRFLKAQPIVDFPRAEAEIQAFWRERNIFAKTLENRKGRPTFVFYEGPPTANGVPHNGHVLTRVMKDLFPRYRTMRGAYVPRKAGWDTHGLPVEVEVEKELGIHGKAEIERFGVQPFIERCLESVFRYTEEWERLTERIGFWVDLDQAYVTYHKEYVESVWWALSELFKKDLLYRGHKVVWWWAQGGTALSSAEVGWGYKTVDDPSVFVAFPLVDEPETSLVVWTTTPWTLPSNMYAAVGKDIDYVVVRDGERNLVVAAALREALAAKLGRALPVERELKGSALLGKRYRPPFDDYYGVYGEREVELETGGREPMFWKVLAAEFVELNQGTGIVHEAPAFGEVDHVLHRETTSHYTRPEDVPLLCAVRPDGTFTEEVPLLSGKWVKDADRDIIRYLKERGLLVHHESYRHDYPFCWRSDEDPLIQYARPAWFIRTTALVHEAIKNNRTVHWLPEHIKEGRFGDLLANNVDWALSRERYWGTPLNIWVNDVTGKMAAPSSMAEILAKNPSAFDSFHAARQEKPSLSEHLIVHKPWIDAVTWTEPGEPGVYRRVPEVIDCWFDAGSMPFAQWNFPHGGHAEFEAAFPADFITEAIDQTRGWFYSLLMISTLLFDEATQRRMGLVPRPMPHPFKTCIVLGHITDSEGKKESKSKGNYTPPEVILTLVAMEFAVVAGETEDGKALVAREDLEGLDLSPGARVKVYRAGAQEDALDLELSPGKKLPRRVVVLSESDRQKLGVKLCERGQKVLPVQVPRLPPLERVTIEDPSTPAPGADAFRWFFLAGNPPWNNMRHSLANVRALQKEFLLKLRNVYSFFTIYASIDDFDPAGDARPGKERALLDRWLLSELSILAPRMVSLMDGYRAYEAARELSDFVDGLSNWYLRRSRNRFWKAEADDDKKDAYATLYEALVTVTKLAAPFVPFVTEEIYQNLVRRPFGERVAESVHLCDYPEVDRACVDAPLSEEMAVVRQIISLGLRVRTEQKIKVRQPLQRAEVVLARPELRARLEPHSGLMEEELNVREVVFAEGGGEHVRYGVKPNYRRLGPRLGKKMQAAKQAFQAADGSKLRAELLESGRSQISIEGESVALEPEDVEIVVEAKEGYAAAGDTTAVVVLSTALTPELVDEGIYRELLSRVQALRKDLDLDYTQRIGVGLSGSERMRRIVHDREEHFKGETLCTDLRVDSEPAPWPEAETRSVEVEGERVTLYIIST